MFNLFTQPGESPGCHWFGQCLSNFAARSVSKGLTPGMVPSLTRRAVIGRRGISIIEVLVSMFILSVGLLGIASLLPIGQRQAVLADQQDRLSSLGQNAVRSFRTRGYSNPAYWIQGDGMAPTNGFFTQPVFIDPLLAAAQNSNKVPHSAAQVIPRFSVKTSTTGGKLNQGGAEAMFMSRDDVIVEPGAKPEDPTKAKYDSGRRDFNGEYSWAAMIAPTYPGVRPPGNDPTNTPYAYGKPYAEQSCQLSIVVFYRRNLNSLTDNDTVTGQSIPRERVVGVASLDGGGIGGGEVTIRSLGGQYDTLLKVGEYVLLYQPPSGTPGDAGYKTYRAQWYRILGAEKFVAGSNRQVTLTGPDWDPSNGYGSPQMIIFDGAVAVYNKTIRLEGPSLWNN